jgi:hypothetical protein
MRRAFAACLHAACLLAPCRRPTSASVPVREMTCASTANLNVKLRPKYSSARGSASHFSRLFFVFINPFFKPRHWRFAAPEHLQGCLRVLVALTAPRPFHALPRSQNFQDRAAPCFVQRAVSANNFATARLRIFSQ